VYRDSRGSTDFLGSKTEIFLFTFIEFVNTRLGKGLTKTAKNATAQMDFFNEKLQQIHQNIKGRWADSNEPTFHLSNPIPISEYLEMDIPGNLSRELCSVGKIYEDTDCYIFNLDSYLQQKLKREKALIGKKVHYLRIYLKGSNFDDLYFWFKLINPGINSTTVLSQIINKSEIKKIESMTAEAK